MLIKALLVALVYYLITWCRNVFGIFHLDRPILVGPLVGLVLGDLKTGIILGATFESVFLGVIAVGGVVPADATIGAVMGTAIAILTNVKSDTALAVGVPVAMLGVVLKQVVNSGILPLFVPKINALAQKGKQKEIARMHIIMGVLRFLLQTTAIFFAVLLGKAAIQSVLSSIPTFVTNGFKAAGAMLPAVGFSLLLSMIFNKKLFAFFFLGFALSIYLKLPSLGIAIMAVIIAIAQFNNMQRTRAVAMSNAAASVKVDEEEDFFNE